MLSALWLGGGRRMFTIRCVLCFKEKFRFCVQRESDLIWFFCLPTSLSGFEPELRLER